MPLRQNILGTSIQMVAVLSILLPKNIFIANCLIHAPYIYPIGMVLEFLMIVLISRVIYGTRNGIKFLYSINIFKNVDFLFQLWIFPLYLQFLDLAFTNPLKTLVKQVCIVMLYDKVIYKLKIYSTYFFDLFLAYTPIIKLRKILKKYGYIILTWTIYILTLSCIYLPMGLILREFFHKDKKDGSSSLILWEVIKYIILGPVIYSLLYVLYYRVSLLLFYTILFH